MEFDFKREARKRYFQYFCVWFILVAVFAVFCAVLGVAVFLKAGKGRTNQDAPAERVYDYAEVLTDAEEELLRQHIAEKEDELRIDIVLVTIDQSVEGAEAKAQYGYRFMTWEDNMQDIADDFWDENRFGYNKGFEGDGILLLHNWHEGQNGEQLSTSGKVERAFSLNDLHTVLNAVDRYYETDPYRAYTAYIDTVERLMGGGAQQSAAYNSGMLALLALIVPLVVASIFAVSHLVQKPAQNTTAVNAYVQGGKPQVNRRSDDFIRKAVTTRRIQTSSGSGGGGGGRSGGGGHHVSRSGASHGGASHRH